MDNSDKQMEMLLEEGGVSDDGMSVDPVSGNEIPPGSLATEVRDDIPAMLSEGEYVVPADVLRFYGVKFFEDLRTEAKMGLSGMEQNGRIGGEPVMEEELPFSDEELMTVDGEEEPIQMNEGGVTTPQATASSSSLYQQDPEDPTQVLMGGGGSTGYELITYYGPNGETVNIPFFNGMPLGLIPAGYTQNAPQEVASDQSVRSDDDDGESISARVKADAEAESRKVDFTDVGSVGKAVDNYYASEAVPGFFAKTGSLPGLAIAGLSYAGRSSTKKDLLSGIDSRIKELDPRQDKGLYEEYQSLRSSLSDKDKYKEQKKSRGFGDSFLGDLLGFDGAFGLSEERRGTSSSTRPDYSSSLSTLTGPKEGLEWLGGERDAYNAAVESGNDAVVEHFQALDKAREAQEAYKRGESTGNVTLSDSTIERLDREKEEENKDK
jgi:hypothetical protein